MTTIADIRAKYPQYEDVSDEQLVKGFYDKFYSDIPYEEFSTKLGLTPQPTAAQQPAVPDVRTEGFATNEGGAAFGIPRQMGGRRAVVQPVTPLEAVGQGAVKGLINPVLAATQVVGGEKGREFVKGIQEQKQAAREEAGLTGVDVAELTTSIFNPINKLVPGGGYAGGAIAAATQPLEGEYKNTFDVLYDKAKQVAGGAVLGKVAENLIGSLTPTLKAGSKELMDRGVKLSPGQAYEGVPGWLFRQIEDLKLGNIFLAGTKANKEEIGKQFNNVVANDVLSSIGQTVPNSVPAGQASVRLAQRRISRFYDDSLKNIGTNPFDKTYKDGINTAIRSAVDNIENPETKQFVQKKLVNTLNAQIGSRTGKDGISGENIKKVQEWLKGEITKLDDKSDVVSDSLKTGYADVLANLNQFITRIDKNGNIAKADSAWAKLYSFADASKRATQQEGVFTAGQLADAAQAQANTVLQAGGGRAALGPESQKYVKVLGTQEPLSLFGKAMLASKLFTGAATTIAAPAIAAPILIASGMTYAAANKLMQNPSATRIAVKKALEKNPGLFGLAGTKVWQDLSKQSEQEE